MTDHEQVVYERIAMKTDALKAPIHVLLVEDSSNDAELLRLTLERAGLKCEILRVDTEEEFRKALDRYPDLIISDYTLPSFDGQAALTIAKKRRPDIPFIFVSGTIGEEAAIESLVSGATDYVLKHKFSRLVPAVQRALKETEERSARREAERRLQVTLEQLQNLFDNLDEVFFSFDPKANRLLQISPACERLYGLSQQAFFEAPQFWKDTAASADVSVVEQAEARLQAGENVSCEYRIARADGTLRWVSTKMKPVRDQAGGIIRVDGIISDITERKELEAQFLRAQRMENLGSLAGGIAHDLNNVLAPMMMGIEILRERYRDPDGLATLTTLETCTARGADLVKQVLMFARGMKERRTAIHPGRLIADLLPMLQRTFPKSLEIATDIAADLCTVSADKTQLEQVLMNLCLNARDAMPDGGSLIIRARNAVDAPSEAKKEPHVLIEVSDTGQGIPPQNLDRIFDPFFTTKEAGTGTGLGLSTVSAIVKSHSGLVSVNSAVGRGTTFRIYLPALVAGMQKQEDLKTTSFPAGNGELVLIVDDEAAIRDLTRTILENYGYRVLVAADGVEGLSIYTKNKDSIRLVLTDLDMPRMKGTQLISELEQIDPGTRVIATGGLIDYDTSGAAITGSVRGVLQKPFSPAQLLQTVRKVIQD